MKNIMKKYAWMIGTISLLLLANSALAATSTVYDYFYYNGLPVTNVFMQNYICLDAGCYTLGPLIQSSNSGSLNLVTTIYPIPSPTFGYATYWYASCYQYMERSWIPTCYNDNCFYTYIEQFAKYQNCIADILTVNASANVSIGSPVNISATIKSAITEAPLAPWGEPSDPGFVRDFLSSQVNATLTIRNSTGHVIFTDSKILYILRDYTNTTTFAPWTPTKPGNYTATIQTTVPDCKCANTIPDTEIIYYEIPGCLVDADCNDQNLCTNDQCIANSCVNSPISCGDGVTCTVDSCNPLTGCVHQANNSYCNDGLWCDGQETCDLTFDCIPSTGPCVYYINECTDVTCDEQNDQCVHTPQDSYCDNYLFCDGEEYCDIELGCMNGTAINCVANNIFGISTCDNNPDNIHYTFDFRNPFTSTCVNNGTNNGYCTTGNNTLTHTCDKPTCNASCDVQNPCANNTCSVIYSDYCNGTKLVEYDSDKIKDNTTISNSCNNTCNLETCGCSNCTPSCSPPLTSSYCVFGVCEAECDSQNPCQNYCIGNLKYYSESCSESCNCQYQIENCNLNDGWYNTTDTQWVATCQCKEKEQQLEEYRDYSCSIGNCTYNVTNTAWVDTGTTRNKTNGTPCNDGLWCTDGDVCSEGVCSGGPRNCHESPDILCTLDSCNETLDQCVHTTDNSFCNDGLYCNGQEYCDSILGCKNGTTIDCSSNNIFGIATCFNNPDNNPFTYDYRDPFTSTCVNNGTNNGYCTTGNNTLTHTCDKTNCGAQCDVQNPCQNYCAGSIRYYSGICQGDCSCSYSTQNCNSFDGWYNTTTTQWVSVGQCAAKEQLLQQYRDYSCAPEGCTFSVTNTQWIDTGTTENQPDGITCDDGLSCTINDTCQSGVCRGIPNDITPPQVLYVFSGSGWVGLGDTFYVDSKIIDDSAICIAPRCLVKIIDNQNKVGYLQGNLTYELSIQKCRGFVTVNDTFHESSAKLVVEVWDSVGHYNSSYTIIGIDNSIMTNISGVNTSLWYHGGDWLNNVTATVQGSFGNLTQCSVDIGGVKPENTLAPSGNKCIGNIKIPSNMTDGNKKLSITAVNINSKEINGTLNIKIDNTPPFKQILSPRNDTAYSSYIPIIVNSTDEFSGVKNGTYRIVQDPWRLFGLIPIPGTDYDSGWLGLTYNGTTYNDNFNTDPLQSGRTYYLSVIMCDNAGNCNSVES